MELRPYQQECINILNNYEGRGIVALAVGLGKTVVATNIERHGRVLFLSHRDELVRQPEKYYDCSFGVEKAEERSNGEEVVSASVQSLSRDNRLNLFPKDAFDTIIVDEAHHAAAPTYQKILNYFTGAKRIIGLTATPKRGDNVRLTDAFDEIIYAKDLRWGIEHDFLSRVRCKQVIGAFSLKGVHKTAGDYNQGDLARVMRNPQVTTAAANAYMEYCYSEKRHTLAYCVSVNACYALQEKIHNFIPEEDWGTITVLTGETPPEERRGILQGFSDGSILCIINCMVLTEGTDLPIADTIINLRPTCNPTLFMQMVGRGTRKYEGKDYCLVLDILPEDGEAHRGLCTAPTLFGVDPALLNKEKRDILASGEFDLLDVCDEILETTMDTEKKLRLVIQDIEDFLGVSNEIIEQNRDDFKKLADLSAEAYTLTDEDPDFGVFYVEKSADAKHRYRIPLTYSSSVYLSEPDMLDNVTVDFDIRWKDVPPERHIGEMKFQEALELISKYCNSLNPYYSYCWNKEMRAKWSGQNATEKQLTKIRDVYRKDYGDNALDGLSKLDASRLIDLKLRMAEKEAYLKTIDVGKKRARKTDAAHRETFAADMEKSAALEESGKKNFNEFIKRTEQLYARKQVEKANEAKQWESGVLRMRCEIRVASGFATPPQKNYIASLNSNAVNNGFVVPDKYFGKQSKGQASFLIGFLRAIDGKHAPEGKKVCFSEEDLDECWRRAGREGILEGQIRYKSVAADD